MPRREFVKQKQFYENYAWGDDWVQTGHITSSLAASSGVKSGIYGSIPYQDPIKSVTTLQDRITTALLPNMSPQTKKKVMNHGR